MLLFLVSQSLLINKEQRLICILSRNARFPYFSWIFPACVFGAAVACSADPGRQIHLMAELLPVQRHELQFFLGGGGREGGIRSLILSTDSGY